MRLFSSTRGRERLSLSLLARIIIEISYNLLFFVLYYEEGARVLPIVHFFFLFFEGREDGKRSLARDLAYASVRRLFEKRRSFASSKKKGDPRRYVSRHVYEEG